MNISGGAVEVQDRRKMYLTLVIALIQSLALSLNLPIQHLYSSVLVTIMNTLLLIAGAFFLVWLSDLNAQLGVGGSIVILLASIILNIPQDILNTLQLVRIPMEIMLLLALLSVILSYMMAIIYRARYRIPVHKIGLRSRFKRYSYF